MPFFISAGMSEDSDYTSDVNFPVQHHHNSSAHQFRGEHQFRLQHEDSKEYYNNESFDRGYEREPDYYQDGGMYYPGRSDTDSEPLYYNSRPNSRPQSFVNDRYLNELFIFPIYCKKEKKMLLPCSLSSAYHFKCLFWQCDK